MSHLQQGCPASTLGARERRNDDVIPGTQCGCNRPVRQQLFGNFRVVEVFLEDDHHLVARVGRLVHGVSCGARGPRARHRLLLRRCFRCLQPEGPHAVLHQVLRIVDGFLLAVDRNGAPLLELLRAQLRPALLWRAFQPVGVRFLQPRCVHVRDRVGHGFPRLGVFRGRHQLHRAALQRQLLPGIQETVLRLASGRIVHRLGRFPRFFDSLRLLRTRGDGRPFLDLRGRGGRWCRLCDRGSVDGHGDGLHVAARTSTPSKHFLDDTTPGEVSLLEELARRNLFGGTGGLDVNLNRGLRVAHRVSGGRLKTECADRGRRRREKREKLRHDRRPISSADRCCASARRII
mmetsp:Transcript_21484/g.54076  ORF Transcript_21484/g.54076 Transcript_21484/m.54076 type:complete len:347 (+) Transcript_21484:2057-3097(+)